MAGSSLLHGLSHSHPASTHKLKSWGFCVVKCENLHSSAPKSPSLKSPSQGVWGTPDQSLTIDYPSRIAVSVGGVNDSPAAKVIGLFGTEILPVATVHHPIGVAVPTACGEHLS